MTYIDRSGILSPKSPSLEDGSLPSSSSIESLVQNIIPSAKPNENNQNDMFEKRKDIANYQLELR